MPQSGQKNGSDLVKLAELEYLFGYRARPVIRGFKNSNNSEKYHFNENACGMPQSGQKKGSDLVKLAEL